MPGTTGVIGHTGRVKFCNPDSDNYLSTKFGNVNNNTYLVPKNDKAKGRRGNIRKSIT
jgi:hypothetical protein